MNQIAGPEMSVNIKKKKKYKIDLITTIRFESSGRNVMLHNIKHMKLLYHLIEKAFSTFLKNVILRFVLRLKI